MAEAEEARQGESDRRGLDSEFYSICSEKPLVEHFELGRIWSPVHFQSSHSECPMGNGWRS